MAKDDLWRWEDFCGSMAGRFASQHKEYNVGIRDYKESMRKQKCFNLER